MCSELPLVSRETGARPLTVHDLVRARPTPLTFRRSPDQIKGLPAHSVPGLRMLLQ
jgi:hypothetical protein